MKSVMVFWLYSAEQYATSTPLYELAEHAQKHGFNDEPVDVLCLFGYDFVPAADRIRLQEWNFHLRDVSALYQGIAARYPNLRQRYKNHFFECFLRWVVIRDYCGDVPTLAWDADIFFNEKLSRLHEEFEGATFTCSSTCFVALHDPRWLEVYIRELDSFERSPAAYLEAVFAKLSEIRLSRRHEFGESFFGEKIAASLESLQAWTQQFEFTPEEMFVDYLVRAGLLPHHVPKGRCDYLFCPLPLILPQLAWVHPMGTGLDGMAGGSSPGDLVFEDGRYAVGGRPLAFLHFQGALFRACAAHQILHEVLQEPSPINDDVYCPPGRRSGKEIIELLFVERARTEERIAQAGTPAEVRLRWGHLYSERDVARNYLIRSDLRSVLSCYGLKEAPADLRIGKLMAVPKDEADFVSGLATFLGSSSLMQVALEETGKVRLTHYRPGWGTALVRETVPGDGDHWTRSRDGQADTVFILGSLEQVPDDGLEDWLKEIWRVTGRNLWSVLPTTEARDARWWEARFLEWGFRKHPMTQLVRPFGAPEVAGEPIVILLEKIPVAALVRHPLQGGREPAVACRDCLRETGADSEALLARYELAASCAKDGDVILHASCDSGSGSAVLARRFPRSRVIAIDPSAAAIDYARLHFGSVLPNLEFHVCDPCAFSLPSGQFVDVVVSIDVLDRVREPGRFLRSVVRLMRPGGQFVASVRNRPFGAGRQVAEPAALNPLDLPRFSGMLPAGLNVVATHRQIAGVDGDDTRPGPLLQRVDSLKSGQLEEAEWWILTAQWTASQDTRGLNPQTAEIACRFASEAPHRPDFGEVRRVLHRDRDIYAGFKLPEGMSSIGYGGALANEEDLGWLQKKAIHERPKPVFAIEVGTFVGSTAVRLGQALKGHGGSHLLCIDSFTGSGEMWFLERFQRDLQFQNGRPRIYELWMDNILRHQLEGTVLPWCLTSLSAAQCLGFLPWVIDFIFLDSAHLQDETYMEIAAYWKVLAYGGLMAGDDYDSFPAVKHDVDRFVRESGVQLIRSPSGRLWGLVKTSARASREPGVSCHQEGVSHAG